MAEPIYDRIKAQLLAQVPSPRQLLQIGPLADELGASTTPVREALIRLATEKLIVYIPKKGFFAKMPSQEELRGLYFLNHTLLNSSLTKRQGAQEDGVKERSDGLSMQAPNGSDAENLAHRTAAFFLQLAKESGINELADIIRNISDRLHHARVVEFDVLGETGDELSKMQGLYKAGQYPELQQSVQSYHDRRSQLILPICKELLFRPFSTGQRKQGRLTVDR